MEYIILSDSDYERLAKKVNDMMKDCWILQGGVSTSWSDDANEAEYIQAMIRNWVSK